MLGLYTPATLTRRTLTGQNADGTPVFTDTVVWTGPCRVVTGGGKLRYDRTGVVDVNLVTIFLPYLTGTIRPLHGDRITAAGVTYTVDSTPPEGTLAGHHIEMTARMVEA